jgi:hypothetical protein
MAKENIFLMMVHITKEIGKIIKCMVKVIYFFLMERFNIKDNGATISSTVGEY